MGFKNVWVTVLFAILLHPAYTQSFEGSIAIHVVTDEVDNTSVLSVKDTRSLLKVEVDSVETIKILKDYGNGTTTVLRSKGDLKFGFRIYSIADPVLEETAGINENSPVVINETNEEERIGNLHTHKIIVTSKDGEAEAWVSTEPGFSVSKYFPYFLGSDIKPALYELRKAADQRGFITRYTEKLFDSNKKSFIDIRLQPEEIPNEIFNVADYIILDEAGMKQLFRDSRKDEDKKNMWEDYRSLFGKK